MFLTVMIQEFSHVYNCHYQFGVSLMAISIDSQNAWFVLWALYAHPPFFKGSITLCSVFSGWLSLLLGCFEGYKAIPP